MGRALELGPFRLVAPVAAGGMGAVWRAVHHDQGVPVAIKVMSGRYAAQPEYLDTFRDEVRAVAGLDHPGIVMVLDHGTVDARAERRSDGSLVAGAPWLAMELCSGGTLKALRGGLPWRDLKPILLAILDALAHAHARGVVHRDLKPGNVLISIGTDLRPGLKLSDFGIAHAMGDVDREGTHEDLISGTPLYMAPEQIRGSWRDYGPWTDLYSLGCMVYWLVGGTRPYDVRGGTGLMVAHLQSDPLPLQPIHPVSDGFHQWLAALMAKRTWDRFQCAADAAAALRALGDAEEAPPREPPPFTPARTEAVELPRMSLGETWRLALDERPALPAAPSGEIHMRAVPASFPKTWKRSLPAPASQQLVGAGMSLYGLRALPLVGREPERDALWKALHDVATTGQAKTVVLRGAAGTGKSRLARWLCERAQELGVANYVKASFSPTLAPGEALQRMGATHIRTGALSRRAVEERVREWFEARGGGEAEDIALMIELLAPAGEPRLRITRPYQYYRGTARGLQTLARERPLVVWLDDIQWGSHGLGLARLVMRTQEEEPFPVLFVLTLREESLSERPEEQVGLRRLMELDRTGTVELGVLPKADHSRLVRDLLGLDGALAARVERRTGGNPLFAVQLVGDWVQRGLLVPSPTGFNLRPGADADLPVDLAQVWVSHLDRILREFRSESRAYLEVAAVLGPEVIKEEWDQTCDDPQGIFGDRLAGDRALRARLVDRLLGERLAVGTVARWSFVHGMLRESLQRQAKHAGRFAAHNLACATMLWSRAKTPAQAPAERLGMHLLAAGQTVEAVAPLLAAVEQRLNLSGPEHALALLETTSAAMQQIGLPESDKRWGKVLTYHARIQRELGHLDAALDFDQRALDQARAHRWAGVERYALHGKATVLLDLSRLEDAEALFVQLHAAAMKASAARHVGQAEIGLARIARRRKDWDTAVDRLQLAADWFSEARDPLGIANTYRLRARCESARGYPDRAMDLYERAVERYEHLGIPAGAADCYDHIARIQQGRGNLVPAETGFRRALSRYEALGAAEGTMTRLRLALVLAEFERFSELLECLAPIRARLGTLDHTTRVAVTLALQLVELAADGHWDSVAAVLGGRETHLEDTDRAHAIIAWCARIVAEIAAARRQPDLAQRALRLAEQQWGLLGDDTNQLDARRARLRARETP